METIVIMTDRTNNEQTGSADRQKGNTKDRLTCAIDRNYHFPREIKV